MKICGKTDVKIPKCDECSELESRVQALEDDTCCEDTRAIVDEHTEQLGTIDNQLIVIQEQIENLTGLRTEVVYVLPEEGEPNVIYILSNSEPPLVGDAIVDEAVLPGDEEETYSMWVYSDNEWVKIAGGDIDLSNYVTFDDLTAALADYIDSSDLTTALATKQDILTAGTGIRIASNVIERVPLNGEIVETDSNTAPGYYGTYQLVDKNMRYRYLDSGMTWAGATSNRNMAISIRDKSIVIRLSFDVKITDDGVRICRIPYATLGLNGAPNQHTVGFSDGGHQIGMFSFYTDGNDMVMDGVDAVPHTGDSKQTWHLQFSMLFGNTNILDSACDRFYWKRIS